MPIDEEKKVRKPANLWLISPNTFLRELLLQEVRMSIIYFIALSAFSIIFFFSSFISSSLLPTLLLIAKYLQEYTPSHIMHSAKQKSLQICSNLSINFSCCLVPLCTVLSQKATRSTKSPVSCIILKAFMPKLSSLKSSKIVSYFDSHLITLLARMISLQTELSLVFGWQALHVLMIELNSLRYLSTFIVDLRCVVKVLSKTRQLVLGF